MFATYVHDLSPVIFRVNDALALRWYGLAYLAAFVVGAWLLNYLAKRKLWVMPPGAAGDVIAGAAIFGVFIGGRLGYVFYYHVRAHGWGWLSEDPLLVFKVWEGGMASHGGVLGLVIFTWFYARKKKVSWLGLGDGLCVVAPLGLMFGRLANFINGELYGHVANGVAWAVKFPDALVNGRMVESQRFTEAMTAAADADPRVAEAYGAYLSKEGVSQFGAFQSMLAALRENPAVANAIAPYLEPRHPSQLYEGLLEGAVLFAILWTIRIRCPKAPDGLLSGLFFILYAVFRIIGEVFREPDADLVGPLTSGQFLSLFMILGGAAFIAVAMKRKAV